MIYLLFILVQCDISTVPINCEIADPETKELLDLGKTNFGLCDPATWHIMYRRTGANPLLTLFKSFFVKNELMGEAGIECLSWKFIENK